MSEEYNPQQDYDREQTPKQKKSFSLLRLGDKPIVTYTLISLTTLVYVIQMITKERNGIDLPMVYGAKYSPYITYYHQYWRLITPVFIHGSIMHILCNMYSLYVVGPALEQFYGHFDFLRFYLICGFAGNALSHVANPNAMSVGASTALFGLFAARVMFLLKNRDYIRNYQNALRNLILVLAVNLTIGLSGGIDNWGHLGGLLGGLLLSYLAGPELYYYYDPATCHTELVNTVPRSRREIAFLFTTIFFAVLAYVL